MRVLRNDYVRKIAICGLTAALSIVIMCLGGFVPIATYICPVLCILIGNIIFKICGSRLAWTWYCAVCILSLFLSPDKEAAIVFVILGYYPYIKVHIEKCRLRFLLKLSFFNGVSLVLYWFMLILFGLNDVISEYSQLGVLWCVVLLILGNVTFLMLDKLLNRRFIKQ